MGVVTVSSSAGRTPIGLNSRFSTVSSLMKKVSILAFKTNKTKKKSLVSPQESVCSPVEASKENPKRLRRARKSYERVQALPTAEVQAPFCILDLDFNEAAAKLENIYKLSPPAIDEDEDHVVVKKLQRRKKKVIDSGKKIEKENGGVNIVRSGKKKVNRLSLANRIELRKKKEIEASDSAQNRIIRGEDNEYEKINRLVREYSASTAMVSLDWKKMKIPPVLPSFEHTWLFKLMQPMKAILPIKKSLEKDLGREPADVELAEAINMNVLQLRKHIKVGNAARNKLIKHNLRLILFVIKKHFQESNSIRFQDLCQAGVDGLITAVDRFEPGRKLRLSTYGLFWIRHSITRSITLASFTKVSFGIESLKSEIHKAKLDLLFELNRTPTEEEIVKKVGISQERYNDVKNASRTVLSLHARNPVTREEYIKGLTDEEADDNRQPALLRLALDDVLDSLKPKESLVIRQRYGLDGKGNRTLGEIAGNLNISREMVRKHEVKALMKLKHPARVDYLRQYFH